MNNQEIRQIMQQELPNVLRQDPSLRNYILETVSTYYAGKQETDSKFDRILAELQQDRQEQRIKWEENNRKWDQFQEENNRKWEEQNRKWAEFQEENNRKWEENNRKWDEQNRKWEEQNVKWEEQNRKWDDFNRRFEEQTKRIDSILEEIKLLHHKSDEHEQRMDKMEARIDKNLELITNLARKHDAALSAVGARWGIFAESSFRNALKGILEDSFNVEVINVNEYDSEGEVFGRPEQIELDLIIKNGLLLICEIKSSMSKPDVYIFAKKVLFYEKHHQRIANRKLIISPMVRKNAQKVATNLGIEVYSHADEIDFD